MPDVFFSTTLHLILRQGLSLSLELDALLAWLATEPQGSHWLCRPRYRNTQPHLAFSMSSRNLHFGSSRSGCGHFTLAWDGAFCFPFVPFPGATYFVNCSMKRSRWPCRVSAGRPGGKTVGACKFTESRGRDWDGGASLPRLALLAEAPHWNSRMLSFCMLLPRCCRVGRMELTSLGKVWLHQLQD